MQRVLFILVGIAAIAVGAAGLTEATFGWSGHGGLSDGQSVASPKPSPSPSASPSPTPTPAPTTAPTVAPTPAGKTATTTSFVHMRAGASINSAIVANLDGGTVVILGPYVDAQWQQVTVAGQNGYIYRSYLAY